MDVLNEVLLRCVVYPENTVEMMTGCVAALTEPDASERLKELEMSAFSVYLLTQDWTGKDLLELEYAIGDGSALERFAAQCVMCMYDVNALPPRSSIRTQALSLRCSDSERSRLLRCVAMLEQQVPLKIYEKVAESDLDILRDLRLLSNNIYTLREKSASFARICTDSLNVFAIIPLLWMAVRCGFNWRDVLSTYCQGDYTKVWRLFGYSKPPITTWHMSD